MWTTLQESLPMMSRITHYPTLIITNIKMNCVFLIILDHTINVYIEIRSYQL